MRHRITVVLSQAQGKHPGRRALEESIVAALIMEPGLDVSVVPYLYDLTPDHTGRMFLESISGDLVMLSWLYPRAAYWVLDRDGITGKWGETQLKPPGDEDEEEKTEEPAPARGIGSLHVRDRVIYCLDLRDFNQADPYIQEIRRIAAESKSRAEEKERQKASQPKIVELGLNLGTGLNGLNGKAPSDLNGVNGSAPSGLNGVNGSLAADLNGLNGQAKFTPEDLTKPAPRRWYPVIDYSRCTNCLECLDFCLFGVYGIDTQDRIVTENQDNCKKGCPACSRVCPEQAIIFPDYKTPAIAGAPVGAIGGLKIDLSRLFGGGDAKDALTQAVEERDRELVADGRGAVGMAVGIPKRQADKDQKPKDDLDNLADALDDLDL